MKRFNGQIRIIILFGLAAAGLTACEDESSKNTINAGVSTVVAEIEAATWAFHAADTARNAEAVADFLWPEFYMFGDGQRADYHAAVQGAMEFFPKLETFATEWTDLRITPLGPNHALASFTFRDSIVTNEGQLIQMTGPNTFVWEKRGNVWKLLYTDADHYPIGEDN